MSAATLSLCNDRFICSLATLEQLPRTESDVINLLSHATPSSCASEIRSTPPGETLMVVGGLCTRDAPGSTKALLKTVTTASFVPFLPPTRTKSSLTCSTCAGQSVAPAGHVLGTTAS